MSDPHDHYQDDFDDEECWNCGGVGRVNDCIDGCCVDQDDPWCEYCSKRCDICKLKMTEKVTVTMVFEIEKALFKSMNPLNTKTPWGIPYAVSIGDALEEGDELRELLDKARLSTPIG